jgi:hypothetical protein
MSVVINGQEVGGYWAPGTNRIVLAGDGTLVGALVRHEMLHALVRQQKGHPREYFLDRCAGVVSCAQLCIDDAGPAPTDEAAPRVPSDVLKLGVSVVPNAPSSSVDGGVFTVIVTATNPNPYAIVITPNPSVYNQSFRYLLTGPAGELGRSEFIYDFAVKHFAPGETKRQYFDLSIGANIGERMVPPGNYRVLGGYDISWIAIDNVRIDP